MPKEVVLGSGWLVWQLQRNRLALRARTNLQGLKAQGSFQVLDNFGADRGFASPTTILEILRFGGRYRPSGAAPVPHIGSFKGAYSRNERLWKARSPRLNASQRNHSFRHIRDYVGYLSRVCETRKQRDGHHFIRHGSIPVLRLCRLVVLLQLAKDRLCDLGD